MGGEIPHDAVHTLEVLLNNMLKPMIEKLEPEDWNVCEEEHKKEFVMHMKKFSQDIHEAIETLTGGITLPVMEKHFESEARTSGKGPKEECVADCRDKVSMWIKIVDDITRENADAEERKESIEEGPLSELDHWRLV